MSSRKGFKFIFSILLAVSLLLFVLGCASAKNSENSGVEPVPDLQYQQNGLAVLNISEFLVLPAYDTTFIGDGVFHDAAFIAKDMKLGLNIGNTMEAYNASGCEKITFTWIPEIGKNTPQDYETCWGSPVITQSMVDGIKAAGFNTVRIPVFWGNMMKNDGTWTINLDYLDRVRQLVDYCFNDDLYVVINCHHFDEFIIRRNNIEDCSVIFSNIWTQIASYFSNYSEKLVFEGFNEYLGGDQFNENGYLMRLRQDVAYELVNRMNESFVKSVRATGGNNNERVLIISGYWTNIDLTTNKRFIVPEDSAENKLMVSVHYVDNNMYWQNQIGSVNWVKYIDNQCGLLEKAFSSKGIPVFLGETTSQYPAMNMRPTEEFNTSAKCLEYVLSKLLEKGFVPVLWDTESEHSFYWRNEKRIRLEDNAEVIASMSN